MTQNGKLAGTHVHTDTKNQRYLQQRPFIIHFKSVIVFHCWYFCFKNNFIWKYLQIHWWLQREHREVPRTSLPSFSPGYILHNYSTVSKPGNRRWHNVCTQFCDIPPPPRSRHRTIRQCKDLAPASLVARLLPPPRHLSPLETSTFSSNSAVALPSFQACYINRIIQYVTFWNRLFKYCIILRKFSPLEITMTLMFDFLQ